MSTVQPQDLAFLNDLGREIVGEVAPDEIEIFDELAGEFYRDPEPNLERRATDDALGFGLDGIVVAATPAVMAVTVVVFSFAVQVATQILVDASADFTRQRVKQWLLGKDNQSIPFGREHLARAHQLALEEAQRYGMAEEAAHHLANALIRRMVTEGK